MYLYFKCILYSRVWITLHLSKFKGLLQLIANFTSKTK